MSYQLQSELGSVAEAVGWVGNMGGYGTGQQLAEDGHPAIARSAAWPERLACTRISTQTRAGLG